MSNISIMQFQQPVIVLSITQLELNSTQQSNAQQRNSNRQNFISASQGEPILCYVYLDDKIQDVRGVCRDETKIKLCENHLHNNLTIKEEIINKSVLIQVKQGGSVNIGFVKIPISILLQSSQNSHIKLWFPLFKDKQHEQITYNGLLNNEYDQQNKIYIDIKLQEEISLTKPAYNHNIQASNPFKGQQDYTKTSNNYNNSSDTYQEISEHITLIQGQPYQESQKIIAQSLGQQIFKKKKKTYTQSANPQIQLRPETVKQDHIQTQPQQQHSLMFPQDVEKILIPIDLLQLLPPNIDKNQIRSDLCQTIDQNIQLINDQSQLKFKELTNFYQNTKQISHNDNKDLIVNDQRDTLLNQLNTDTQVLLNTGKDQENVVQQLQTQIKLLQIHGGHQQKREKLEIVQQTIEQLKSEIKDIQYNKAVENKINSIYDQNLNNTQNCQDESKTLQDQISYMKQELQMLIQLSQQKIDTKSVLDSVFNESDKIKDQFIRQQENVNEQMQIYESDQNNIDREQMKLQQQLLQLKRQQVESQQIIQRQQLELKIKHKHIDAEQLSINSQNDKLQELIEKQQANVSTKQQHLEKQQEALNNLLQQKQQHEIEIQKEQAKYQELLNLSMNDGNCLQSSQDVQQNQLQIHLIIDELKLALNDNQQKVQQYIEVCNALNTNISDDNLQKILNNTQTNGNNGSGQILCDKNEILNTKSQRCVDLQTSIDQVHDQIDYQQYKSQIYGEFKDKLNKLQTQENQVQTELQKIRNINQNLTHINQDSHEKLDIQQSDIYQFEQDLQQYTQLKQIQRQKEQQMLDRLLTIRTKQEFNSDMRLRLQQIRELESSLRGKDNELDTLEMIQQQKDEIIFELEDEAGKVREIVQGNKQNNYNNLNNQKHQQVEKALKRYLQLHPSVIEIKKIGDGYFKYGTRRIYVKLNSKDQSTLLVRIAPKEYITLSMFMIENESIELNKLKTINQQLNSKQQL